MDCDVPESLWKFLAHAWVFCSCIQPSDSGTCSWHHCGENNCLPPKSAGASMDQLILMGGHRILSWKEVEDGCILEALLDEDEKDGEQGGDQKAEAAGYPEAARDGDIVQVQERLEMPSFKPHDLTHLATLLGFQSTVKTKQYAKVPAPEALAIALHRLYYPSRLRDLECIFGRHISVISSVVITVMKHICDTFGGKLNSLQSHPWLTEGKLAEYAQAMDNRGVPRPDCWGILNVTSHRICRPTVRRKEHFSAIEFYHCMKFQSVNTPDGLILNLAGPFEGGLHDKSILDESALVEQLEDFMKFPEDRTYALYHEQRYTYRPHLLVGPYRPRGTTALTRDQVLFNSRMSTARHSVEWGAGKMTSLFGFLDYHKNQKMCLQGVPEMYKAAAILCNVHTCMYGSLTSSFFEMQPPPVVDYVQM